MGCHPEHSRGERRKRYHGVAFTEGKSDLESCRARCAGFETPGKRACVLVFSEERGEEPMTSSGGNLIGSEVNRNKWSPQCGATSIEVAGISPGHEGIPPAVRVRFLTETSNAMRSKQAVRRLRLRISLTTPKAHSIKESAHPRAFLRHSAFCILNC